MKLNSFYEKNNVPLRRDTKENVINVHNEVRESKLQASIDKLNEEITRLSTVEKQHLDLRKTHAVIQEQLSEANSKVDLLEQTKLRTAQDLLYYDKKMKEFPAMQEELNSWRHESSDFKNKYFDVSATVAKQGNLITDLEKQRDTLQSENQSLSQAALDAEHTTSALVDEFEAVKISYREIEKKFGNVSKIYTEAKRTTNQLKDDKAYWEALARSVQTELEAKNALSDQLKEWIGQLENSNNQTQAEAQVGSTKVGELQTVVTDMAKSLEDLAEERDYLNAVNDTLKLQLSKAGHASVGAIGKKEGFKMSLASSALNWNKNYLGTARPTLLKFRHREETHDHS